MTILPLTYLGSTEYFAHLAHKECVIDVGENWVKQTARNRCEIMTSGGVAALTVPVHGGGEKTATKDIRIDNSKRWQHRHWTSIVSAYRNSPFFDHYEGMFVAAYTAKFDLLADFNFELLGIVGGILGIGISGVSAVPGGSGITGNVVEVSEKYIVASPEDTDLRGKKALRRQDTSDRYCDGSEEKSLLLVYTQVFCDRMPFIAGLSVVDLIFCEGPAARELLGLL